MGMNGGGGGVWRLRDKGFGGMGAQPGHGGIEVRRISWKLAWKCKYFQKTSTFKYFLYLA